MNCIVSVTSDDFTQISNCTFPFMKKYAHKVGADFEYIDATNCSPYWHPSFKKRDIYDLLEKYNRIFYIDADAIVLPVCPNVFDLINDDNFAGIPDIIQPNKYHLDLFSACNKHYKQQINIIHKFINGGVFLIPKIYKDVLLFSPEIKEEDPRYHWTFEQNELSYRLNMIVPVGKMYYLNPKFNATTLDISIKKQTNNYILHYLGRMSKDKKKIIPRDTKVLRRIFTV